MILDFDNKFFTIYNKELFDDYFINRTMMNKNVNKHIENKNEIEKIIHSLISISNSKKINLYLHINSDQTFLEEYLLTNNYEKIDEVIGLQYPDYSNPDTLNVNYDTSKDYSTLSQVLLVNNIEELKEWVNVYCLSFDISSDKKFLIYKILKKKFNIFYFVLSKITTLNDTHENARGCCILFPYRHSIALYCLGTKKEYRHNNVATNIIDFSIRFGKENGYRIFGLQTLQSDNLLSFYERKGFVKIYSTKIYKHMNS
jgi:ribosomal protein S18 acetylase RimI-like enzyme